jgi:hypothetical protein
MTAIHILLQAGNVTISSAVNQFVNEVGVPAFDAVLFIGGLSFIIAIVMALLHFVEYLWHPTSFGRTSALTEAIFHAKKPIYGALGIFLAIYITLLAIGLASGNAALTSNAGTYALEVLEAMLRETASVFNYLIQHAMTTSP